jgi:hypothetical protein
MFFFWGTARHEVIVRKAGTQFCDTCEVARPFSDIAQYRTAHIYFCRWVTHRQYIHACDVCGKGLLFNKTEFEAKLETDPIPFWDRKGWLIPASTVTLTALFVTWMSVVTSPTDSRPYMQGAKVGDLWLMDYTKLSIVDTKSYTTAYGVARVNEVTPDGIILKFGNHHYDSEKSAYSSLAGDTHKNEANYYDQLVLFNEKNLVDIKANQVVKMVYVP